MVAAKLKMRIQLVDLLVHEHTSRQHTSRQHTSRQHTSRQRLQELGD